MNTFDKMSGGARDGYLAMSRAFFPTLTIEQRLEDAYRYYNPKLIAELIKEMVALKKLPSAQDSADRRNSIAPLADNCKMSIIKKNAIEIYEPELVVLNDDIFVDDGYDTDDESFEDCQQISNCSLEARETHPFFTELGLVGGGKKKKKQFQRKGPAKMAERGADKVTVPKKDGPVPAELIIEHTLVQTIAIGVVAAGATLVTTFKGNAPWSSNIAAIQPYGWAADAGVKYAKYRTTHYKYHVELPNAAANMRLGIVNYPSVLASVTTPTADGILAMPHTKSKTIGVNTPSIKISGSVSVEKVLGATFPEAFGDDNFSAIVTADPARLAYLNILVSNLSAATPASPFIIVTLKFRDILYQPIQLTPLFARDMMKIDDAFKDERLHKTIMDIVESVRDKNDEDIVVKNGNSEDLDVQEYARLCSKFKKK